MKHTITKSHNHTFTQSRITRSLPRYTFVRVHSKAVSRKTDYHHAGPNGSAILRAYPTGGNGTNLPFIINFLSLNDSISRKSDLPKKNVNLVC